MLIDRENIFYLLGKHIKHCVQQEQSLISMNVSKHLVKVAKLVAITTSGVRELHN